jgi:hypothetical protein
MIKFWLTWNIEGSWNSAGFKFFFASDVNHHFGFVRQGSLDSFKSHLAFARQNLKRRFTILTYN